ncbi:dentin sialophosphoprotein-like isoform X3 [Ranitomeya imitator]|uniref:dentin sialophosphoprotein-like isoform X3 n=1 Tax=Ranitomeya imitator TaxID=111125 RepID=UPI0037E7D33F
MEQSDNRSPSEDENHSQETTESCRSCQSSLEMDCSEPYSDQTGESSTQEMTSASSSLESYMDYSEETEQNEEEENRNDNNNNDINASTSPRRQDSVTVNISSKIGSQDLSPNKESPSQAGQTQRSLLMQIHPSHRLQESGLCIILVTSVDVHEDFSASPGNFQIK